MIKNKIKEYNFKKIEPTEYIHNANKIDSIIYNQHLIPINSSYKEQYKTLKDISAYSVYDNTNSKNGHWIDSKHSLNE